MLTINNIIKKSALPSSFRKYLAPRSYDIFSNLTLLSARCIKEWFCKLTAKGMHFHENNVNKKVLALILNFSIVGHGGEGVRFI